MNYQKIAIAFIIFSLAAVTKLYATPASEMKLPDAVRASIRFLPGKSTDYNGSFEIEVYCQARFDIESLEIVITHPDNIIFAEELPSFNGNIKAGKAKLWKIKGVINEDPEAKGKTTAGNITLRINYLYPFEEGLNYIRENGSTDIFGRKYNMRDYVDPFIYRRYKGKTMKVIKTVRVKKPFARGAIK